jgi:hypothetical protein
MTKHIVFPDLFQRLTSRTMLNFQFPNFFQKFTIQIPSFCKEIKDTEMLLECYVGMLIASNI